MRSLLTLWLIFQSGVVLVQAADPVAELCGASTWEKDKKKGDTVTLCSAVWKDPQHPALLYLRLRRSQSQNGFYEIWEKIQIDKLTEAQTADGRSWYVMNFTFSATISYHYFATAVYSEKDANGNTILKESVGSGHARINVTP